MFTGRQKRIIELIAGSIQGVYGSSIARTLEVSSRTVRNEIQSINVLWKNTCKICSSNKHGYYFDDKDMEFVRHYLYQNDQKKDIEIKEENRAMILIGMLICKTTWNVYDISESMFLSAQSVFREINKLKAYLGKEFQIDPIQVKGEEIKFQMEEPQVRKLLMKIMKNEVQKTDNTKLPCLKDLLFEEFDQIEFTFITKKIEDFFIKRQIMLTDESLIMVSGAIYISYVRNMMGYTIKEIEVYENDKVIDELLNYLMEIDTMLMESDKALLHDFLHIFKLNDTKESYDEISDFSIRVFDEFCNEVMDKYSLDLRSSHELYQNMLIHIEYMIRRLTGDYELLNPILKDVKKNYPFSYEVSTLMIHIVYKYLDKYLQDDEISYIAIYIQYFVENINQKLKVVLVATSRKSVMNIIHEWLRNNFRNQIEVCEVPSQHALDLYSNEHKVEFIISLSDTIAHPKIPMYRISDFPSEIDQRQINSIIRKICINYRFKDIVDKVFSSALIEIYDEKVSFESVITDMSNLLMKQKYIEDAHTFTEDILLREVNYPTFLNERFMIPHPLSTFAKQTAVAVAIVKKPIKMNHHHIQIIFTLAIERKQNDDINVLFDFFKQIAAHKDAMNTLAEVTSPDVFVQMLLHLSNSM